MIAVIRTLLTRNGRRHDSYETPYRQVIVFARGSTSTAEAL